MLRPGEMLIHAGNWQAHAALVPTGQGRGLIPRDYEQYPRGCYSALQAVDFPTIPRAEWSERARDQAARGQRLSDVMLAMGVPCLDQNGKGYCLLAGSLIRMADGSQKPVEYVKAGEAVISHLGNARKVVTPTSRRFTGDLVSLLPPRQGDAALLTATSDHRLWLPSREWEQIGSLKAGRRVTFNGEGATLWGTSRKAVVDHPVHCLEVEEDHGFIANGFAVSNCWAHSTTGAVQAARAVMNEPTIGLSAYSVACKIKGFRDQGGWGAQSAEFIAANGVADETAWPQRSMSRALDNPATWENAKRYRLSVQLADMAVAQYNRGLTFEQYATCWLLDCPTVDDWNWWGHSTMGCDLVEGASCWGQCRSDSGKMMTLEEFDAAWDMDDPVSGGWGHRIRNSWSETWGQKGFGVLAGSKAVPDGGVGVLVVTASAA